MATYIPPIQDYYFNGTSMVCPQQRPPFYAPLLLAIFALITLFPVNNPQAHPSNDVRITIEQSDPDQLHSAVAQYILRVNASLNAVDALNFARYAVEASKQFEIELPILLALVKVESGFNPEAVSHRGAIGLTQVIPKWHLKRIEEARQTLDVYSIYEPKLNLYVGAGALRAFINETRNLTLGLLRYNGSSGDTTQSYAKLVIDEAYNVNLFLQRQKL